MRMFTHLKRAARYGNAENKDPKLFGNCQYVRLIRHLGKNLRQVNGLTADFFRSALNLQHVLLGTWSRVMHDGASTNTSHTSEPMMHSPF